LGGFKELGFLLLEREGFLQLAHHGLGFSDGLLFPKLKKVHGILLLVLGIQIVGQKRDIVAGGLTQKLPVVFVLEDGDLFFHALQFLDPLDVPGIELFGLFLLLKAGFLPDFLVLLNLLPGLFQDFLGLLEFDLLGRALGVLRFQLLFLVLFLLLLHLFHFVIVGQLGGLGFVLHLQVVVQVFAHVLEHTDDGGVADGPAQLP